LCESLPNLARRISDDRILIGVIVGISVKHGDTDGALLQLVSPAGRALFDDESEKIRASPARPEWRTPE
jgi:hypothetical protein